MSFAPPQLLSCKGRWQPAGLTEGCPRLQSKRSIPTGDTPPSRKRATPPLPGEDFYSARVIEIESWWRGRTSTAPLLRFVLQLECRVDNQRWNSGEPP